MLSIGEDMANYLLGVLTGCMIWVFIILSTMGEEKHTCERDNNVYSCERVYIPQID